MEPGNLGTDDEGCVPEGLNLASTVAPGRPGLVAVNTRVHPGIRRRPWSKKPLWSVPAIDVGTERQIDRAFHVAEKFEIAGILDVFPEGADKPERSVDGVIDNIAIIAIAVRQSPVVGAFGITVLMPGEIGEDAPGLAEMATDEQRARERDESVPPPVVRETRAARPKCRSRPRRSPSSRRRIEPI